MFHQTTTCEGAKVRRQGANPVARPRACRFPLLPVLAAALVFLLGAEAARAQQVPLAVLGEPRTCADCPADPTGTAEPGPGAGEITLNWEWSVGTNGVGVTSWVASCTDEAGNIHGFDFNIAPSEREYTCENLTPGQKYRVNLAGFNFSLWKYTSHLEALVRALDPEPPKLRAARTDGLRLWLTFDEALYPEAVPPPPAFEIHAGDDRMINHRSVSVAGDTVVLDLKRPLKRRDFKWLTYVQPESRTSRRVRDFFGNESAEFTIPDTYKGLKLDFTDTRAPKLLTASVAGKTVVLTFDETLDSEFEPPRGSFVVDGANSGAIAVAVEDDENVDTIKVAGHRVTLTLEKTLVGDELGSIGYDPPGGLEKRLQDPSGNFVAAISGGALERMGGHDNAPQLTGAEVIRSTLTLSYDEKLDRVSVPAAGSFTVTVAGSAVDLAASNPVAVGETAVTLTLAEPVFAGETVTLDYTAPDDNPIQDLALRPADDLSGRSVENNTAGGTVPALTRAVVAGRTLTLSYSEALDRSSVPAAAAFTVRVGGSAVGLAASDPVSVGETAVTLTLAQAVAAGARVTLDYTAPTVNPIQNLAGYNAAGFSGQFVGNAASGDTRAPEFLSVTVSGKTVVLTYDEALDPASTPPAGAYLTSADGTNFVNPDVVSVAGHRVTLTMATAVTGVVLVLYAWPDVAGSAKLADYAGNLAAEFPNSADAKRAINIAGDTTAPLLTRAVVAGRTLTLSYSEALDRSSVPAAAAFTVRVGGSAVGLAASDPVSVGETAVTLTLAQAVAAGARVTLDYTAPTVNPIQNLAGYNAAGFSGQFVGNAASGDTRAPEFLSVTVSGKTVVLTYDEALDPASTPPAGAYLTSADGTNFVDPDVVSVAGHRVTLTMATAVTGVVLVLYAWPDVAGSAKLADYAGNLAAEFPNSADAKLAINIAGDTTAPLLTWAVVAGRTLTLSYSEALDRSSVPAAAAFTVRVGGSAVGLAASDPVSVGETAVTLTLAQAVTASARVTLDYTVPGDNPIRDLAGNAAAPLSGQFVGNAVGDTRVPEIRYATVNGTTLKLVFDEGLDPASAPAGTRFTVQDLNRTISTGTGTARIDGAEVTVTLGTDVTAAQMVDRVQYRKPNTNPLQDHAGNAVGNVIFEDDKVRNISGDTTAPALTRAVADGATLTLRYGERLDRVSVPAAAAFTVKVNGDDVELGATGGVSVGERSVTLTLAAAVSAGDAATVAYAAPQDHPIRDLAGNAAAPIAERTARNVTSDPAAGPSLRMASLEGKTLTLVFSETLDPASAPAGDQFTIVSSGSTVSTGTGTAGIEGAVVTVTMNRAVTAANPVMKYRAPSSNPLKDLDGNAALSSSMNIGSSRVVRVASVAITSRPDVDADGDGVAESYGRGDAVEVTVTWDEPVTWDVSASNAVIRVTLKVPRSNGRTNTRTATLATDGATRGRARELVFRYVVQADDMEAATPKGIEVVGGTLVKLVNGATLEVQNGRVRQGASSLSADLGHQVRGAVAPAPKLTRTAVVGSVLTLSYSKKLDRASVPAAGAFTVKVDGSPVPLAASGAVSVGETAVTLTLADPVAASVRVTVDYAVPTVNPIRDLDGNAAAPLSGQFVVNATSGDTRAPAFLLATLNGAVLTMIYDEELDTTSVPPPGAFSIIAAKSPTDYGAIAVTGVAVTGARVTLTLARALGADERSRLTYRRSHAGNRPLQDWSGNRVDLLLNYLDTVDVTGDTTAPLLTRAVADGTALTLTYGEKLDRGSVPAAGAFTVNVNGRAVALAASGAVAVGETAVALTLARLPDGGGRVTVDYAAPSVDPIRDLAGNESSAFSGQFAGSVPGKEVPGAPALRHATVDGTTLKLVFNKELDPASAPAGTSFRVIKRTGTIGSATLSTGTTAAASIDGAVVTVTLRTRVTRSHNVILVRYDRPGENPLTDFAGNAAGDQFAERGNIRVVTDDTSTAQIKVTSEESKKRGEKQGVEITSRPTFDADGNEEAESYVEGDRVDVTVTWDRYVTWDGADMRVQLEIGGSTRNAELVTRGAASGTAQSLVFRYVVQADDVDTDGIVVLGGSPMVKLSGGATLTDIASDRAAARAHPALGANDEHQVRRREAPPDTSPPRLVAGKMEFLGPDPKTGGTRFTLQFSEALHPDSNDVKPYLNFRYVDESDGLPNAMVTVEGKTLVMHAPGVWIDGSMGNAWVEIGDTSHIRDLAGNAMAPLERRFPLVNTSTGSPGSPRLASAAVIGDLLTLAFDQTLDQAEVPTKDAFKVLKTSAETSVSEVAVGGSVVTLTLSRVVGAEDGDIQVTYSKNRETGAPLCNLWGSEVAEFKRDIARDSERPKLVEGTIDGLTAKLLYDEALDATGAPSTGQFTLSAEDGTDTRALAVDGVSIAGATVTLTLASAATAAETVTVVFADATGIRDLAGNRAAAQSDAITLTNTGASRPGAPELVEAAGDVKPAAAQGKSLTLTFTQKLDPTLVPAASAFTVWTEVSPDLPRTEIPVHAVTIDRKAVLLTLRRAVPPGAEEYKVTYAEPPTGHPRLRNLWLEAVAGFEETVSVTVPDTLAPKLVRAEVAGDELKLTFDEALDASSAPPTGAFEVRASAPDDTVNILRGKAGVDAEVADNVVTVELREKVRQHELLSMDYQVSKAGGNALIDAAGNRAASIRNARAENVDVYPPKLLSATVDEQTLTLKFSEALDETRTPDASAFTFSTDVTGGVTPFVSTATSGTTVTITMTGTAAAGNFLTISWTSETNIRDLAGNQLVGDDDLFVVATNLQNPASAAPAVQSITVNEAYLTIRYDWALDAGVVPALEAYELRSYSAAVEGLAIGQEGSVARLVKLALGAPVPPCEKFEAPGTDDADDPGNLILTYDRSKATIADTAGPVRGPLQSPWGGLAADIEPPAGGQMMTAAQGKVTNARADSCATVRPGAGGTGEVVELNFYRSLATDEAPPATAFSLSGASGASAPAVSAATFAADGTGVKLTLDRALVPGETATVSYARPKAGGGLWDAEGKELASFSGVAVTAPEGATGVAIVSDAGSDDTYALGQAIRVAVTFSEAVDVDTAGGAPRLKIDMDPAHWGTKWAAYEGGSGTDTLTFVHEVVKPNISTKGLAVLADTLETNGGAIRSAATGADAALGHAGLGHDPAHKVDWQLAPAGAVSVTGVALSSRPAEGHTYGSGEAVRVRVTFSDAVEVDTAGGAPRLRIDMDPAHWGAKWAAYEGGSGTNALTFVHEVVEPNESTQGIAVLGVTLELNGGAIRSAGADVHLSHGGLGHDPVHKVDWRLAPSTEPVPNAPATGTPAIAGTARVGETLTASTADIADADGMNGASFAYQWVSSDGARDADITGQTASSLTLTEAQQGHTIKVRVAFTDDAAHAETLTSAATTAVERRPNRPATGPPAITGTAQVGETLAASTADIADADGLSNAAFTYQWISNDGAAGTDIAGATGSSYTLTAADVGRRISVRVAFTDDNGHAETLTSAATTAVERRPNRPATGAPAITGTPQAGETLTASTAGIADADGLSNAVFTYQWMSNDGGAAADVAGATGASYTLADADVGKRVSVRVSFTDDAGYRETLTSAPTAAVLPRPLTASFHGMPAEHNGRKLFSFELRFSDDFPTRCCATRRSRWATGGCATPSAWCRDGTGVGRSRCDPAPTRT